MAKPHHVVPLIAEDDLSRRIKELAGLVAQDYRDEELVLVGVLHGGAALLTDLARELWRAGMQNNVYKDYIGMSSYGANVDSSGKVMLSKKLKNPIAGRNVLIVEDIVDTGRSLAEAKKLLSAENPKSLKVLSLLSKPSRREVEVGIDYLGFEIPNEFVVGYDLDYDEMYRTMPYVGKVIFD